MRNLFSLPMGLSTCVRIVKEGSRLTGTFPERDVSCKEGLSHEYRTHSERLESLPCPSEGTVQSSKLSLRLLIQVFVGVTVGTDVVDCSLVALSGFFKAVYASFHVLDLICSFFAPISFCLLGSDILVTTSVQGLRSRRMEVMSAANDPKLTSDFVQTIPIFDNETLLASSNTSLTLGSVVARPILHTVKISSQ